MSGGFYSGGMTVERGMFVSFGGEICLKFFHGKIHFGRVQAGCLE